MAAGASIRGFAALVFRAAGGGGYHISSCRPQDGASDTADFVAGGEHDKDLVGGAHAGTGGGDEEI